MTTKRTRTPKQEAKLAAFRSLAAQLEGEFKAGKHTERIARAAREVKGIARYSDLNQLMIIKQCPQATEVHGYNDWLTLGYKANQPGIPIRAPHTLKEKEGVGFHRAYVWDITQVVPISQEAQAQEQPPTQDDQEQPEAQEAEPVETMD